MAGDGAFAPAKTIGERAWYRLIICVLTLALLAATALYGALAILCYGPSPTARNIYVAMVAEHEAPPFLVRIFFSEERVQEILVMSSEAP